MNRRFLAALVLSVVFHASMLRMGESEHPPALLLARGEISVDLLPSPAVSPRPLREGPERQQIQDPPVKPAPEPGPTPTTPEEGHVSEGRPEEAPSQLRVRESPPLGSAPESFHPPEAPSVTQAEEQRPLEPVQQVSSAGEAVDTPRKEETASAEPMRPPAPEATDSPRTAQATSTDPVLPHPAESPQRAAPAPASSSRLASLPAIERAQGVRVEARLLGSQKPTYPREAQLRGLEGRAVLSVQVSADGRVVGANLHLSSGHKVLDDAALHFAASLRFLPARRGGAPIPTNVLLPIRYRLVDQP